MKPFGHSCSAYSSRHGARMATTRRLQFHQPLGREGDHVAQELGVGALLEERTKRHRVACQGCVLGSGCWRCNPTLTAISGDDPAQGPAQVDSCGPRPAARKAPTPRPGTRPMLTSAHLYSQQRPFSACSGAARAKGASETLRNLTNDAFWAMSRLIGRAGATGNS